jgi:hypothetical protein
MGTYRPPTQISSGHTTAGLRPAPLGILAAGILMALGALMAGGGACFANAQEAWTIP